LSAEAVVLMRRESIITALSVIAIGRKNSKDRVNFRIDGDSWVGSQAMARVGY